MEFTVIILAAGKGTRMRSKRAKPLHEIAGKALISWVMDAAIQAGCTDILVVTSPEQDELQHAISDNATLYIQKQQNGTADAVRAAQSHLDRLPADRPVIILYADTPLITPDTIAMLISQITAGTDLCVSGFETDAPTGYGRLKTDASGGLVAIIEESDANQDEKTITHVNGGIMAGKAGLFQTILPTIGADNAQQEYYLTDMVSLAYQAGHEISYQLVEASELAGINDRAQLATAEHHMQERLRAQHLAAGVSMIAPQTVTFAYDTQIGADTLIEPNVFFGRGVQIAGRCHIKGFSHIEGAELAESVTVGPFARLRPGTRLDADVKVGNFVEIKKSHLEKGAKASHLSYLGDSQIGAEANIGAGTITCNYDGQNKYQTIIGAGAFIGSNSSLVAPVQIGDNALIGAGSVITSNVDADALSLARAEQRTITQGAKRMKSKTKTGQS